MGRYNRQARRKMRKILGAGAKISNDALNGIWYKDDSQIVEYGVIGKWYAESPRVYVRLDREVEDGQE